MNVGSVDLSKFDITANPLFGRESVSPLPVGGPGEVPPASAGRTPLRSIHNNANTGAMDDLRRKRDTPGNENLQ